jgi:dynein heavy chain
MSSQLKDIVATEFTQSIEKFKQTSVYCARVFPQNELAASLKTSVTEFAHLAPVIATLRTLSLKERHWKKIEGLLHQEGLEKGDIRIQALVTMGAAAFSEAFATIAVEAENEETLESMINDLLFTWSTVQFIVLQAPDNVNQLVLFGIPEITEVLDDSLVKCSTIHASRYVGAIKSSVDRTMSALTKVDKILELVTSVQKEWLYLQNISKDSDIQRQLSNEFKVFHEVDREYRDWVRNVRDKPRVYWIAVQNEEAIKCLQIWDKKLENIQKALEIFLMGKRTEFPRFFFLSNDDLIEILSLGKDPVGMRKHLNKLFENIYGFRCCRQWTCGRCQGIKGRGNCSDPASCDSWTSRKMAEDFRRANAKGSLGYYR